MLPGACCTVPCPTHTFFKGFSGQCEASNNGDAVARYDQLADRWVIVMPELSRQAPRPDQPRGWRGATVYQSPAGVPSQPGDAAPLFEPPRSDPSSQAPSPQRGRGAALEGPYSMCYAVSVGSDPFGPYYRYEFLRPLFPD